MKFLKLTTLLFVLLSAGTLTAQTKSNVPVRKVQKRVTQVQPAATKNAITKSVADAIDLSEFSFSEFKPAPGHTQACYEVFGDTLQLFDFPTVNYIKFNDKVYKVIRPVAYLEEQRLAWPLHFGEQGGTLIPGALDRGILNIDPGFSDPMPIYNWGGGSGYITTDTLHSITLDSITNNLVFLTDTTGSFTIHGGIMEADSNGKLIWSTSGSDSVLFDKPKKKKRKHANVKR